MHCGQKFFTRQCANMVPNSHLWALLALQEHVYRFWEEIIVDIVVSPCLLPDSCLLNDVVLLWEPFYWNSPSYETESVVSARSSSRAPSGDVRHWLKVTYQGAYVGRRETFALIT